MKKMSFRGFKTFFGKHLSIKGIGYAAVGLALPAIALAGAAKINLAGTLGKIPLVSSLVTNPYGSWAIASVLTAGIAYTAYSMEWLSQADAIGINSIAMALMLTSAAKTAGHLPSSIAQYVPDMPVSSSLAGYSGYNGYLGYLGDEHEDSNPGFDPSGNGQLYGVTSGHSVNVF